MITYAQAPARLRLLVVGATSLAVLSGLAPALVDPAWAGLSGEQRACVNGLARTLGKLDRQVTKQIYGCLQSAARDRALNPDDPAVDTLEECAVDDPRGTIGELAAKTVESFTKFCTPPPGGTLDGPFPGFGATDAATVNAEGLRAGADLMHDLFGADLDGGIVSTDRDAAKCQQAAWKTVAKCQRARLVEVKACLARALAGSRTVPAAASKGELRDACLGMDASPQPDPRGRIAKTCTGPPTEVLDVKCGGQDVDALLPGCAGAPEVAPCLDRMAACRACLAASQAHDLDRDCDLLDDGTDNASCSLGPATVLCENPADGAMLPASVPAALTVRGRASHPAGVAAVAVNGTPVALDPDGRFSAAVVAEFGINVVDVVVTNGVGEQSAATCTFLAASDFSDPNVLLDGSVSLKLLQAAIDDGGVELDLNSLGDIVHTVLHSEALTQQLHDALIAANPLKPLACDQAVCVPLVGCICVLETGITYLSSSIPLREPSLALASGGVAASTLFQPVDVQLRVAGRVGGVPFDTVGWVRIGNVGVALVWDVFLSGGRPRVQVRPGSVSASAGPITTDFAGLDGAVLDIVSAVAPALRNNVRDLLVHVVQSNATTLLDALIGNLDLGPIVTNVPRLAGAGFIPVSMGFGHSSLSTTTSRMLFGLGTHFTAPAAHGLPSLGVPIPAGPVLLDPAASTPTAVAAHVGVLNQVLHALWRGGLLEATLDGSVLLGVPAGTTVDVEGFLPPVAIVRPGNALGLQIGALRATVTSPALPDGPVTLMIGADASAGLALVGDAVEITSPTLDALHLSAPDAALDAARQALLEAAAGVVLQRTVEAVLAAAAATAVRVPVFVIPASLAPYGLPAEGELGLITPTLSTGPRHLQLSGGFDIR